MAKRKKIPIPKQPIRPDIERQFHKYIETKHKPAKKVKVKSKQPDHIDRKYSALSVNPIYQEDQDLILQ